MHETMEANQANHRHICSVHACKDGTLILTENEDTIEKIKRVCAVAGARTWWVVTVWYG